MKIRIALRIHLSESTFKGLSLFDGYLVADRGCIDVKVSKPFKILNKYARNRPN